MGATPVGLQWSGTFLYSYPCHHSSSHILTLNDNKNIGLLRRLLKVKSCSPFFLRRRGASPRGKSPLLRQEFQLDFFTFFHFFILIPFDQYQGGPTTLPGRSSLLCLLRGQLFCPFSAKHLPFTLSLRALVLSRSPSFVPCVKTTLISLLSSFTQDYCIQGHHIPTLLLSRPLLHVDLPSRIGKYRQHSYPAPFSTPF